MVIHFLIKGNFVAVGTFDPQVEIWDLDTLDTMFPHCILGQIPELGKTINSKKSKHGPARVAKRVQADRHVDAVMAIAWNPVQKNLIATGSADTTIKLWDMQNPEKALHSYSHHTDKVQAVAWNPNEPTVLLSGGYDKRACVFDSRQPEKILEWNLGADVECMKWDPHHAEMFYVSTEDGVVKCYVAKVSNSKPEFTLHAHNYAVTSIDINPHIPNFFVTGSADKTVKLWNVRDGKPICLATKDLQCVRFI
jgi:periodic tryptophan protein 1